MRYHVKFWIEGDSRAEIMEQLRSGLPTLFPEYKDSISIQAVDLVPKPYYSKEVYTYA